MKDLFRVHCARLFRHKIFLAGTVIAFAATYWFTSNAAGMDLLHQINTDFDFALMASLGIPAFFSVFTALFFSAEYTGGTIRNKLICGKSRTMIYFSAFLTMELAMLIMTAAWAAGGLLAADTLPGVGVMISSIVNIISYNTAQIAFLIIISMNMTNEGAVTAIEFMSFQASFFAVMMLQMMAGSVSDAAGKVIAVIINMIPMGQWLSHSAISDSSIHMPAYIQLIISAVMIVLMSVIGSRKFAEKDIK